MTQKDRVFVADVVVTDLTQETVVSSVINWPIDVVVKLNAMLKSASIESFMRGTILFWWPWKCTTHLGMIGIVSLESVHVFSMIDNREVIYPCPCEPYWHGHGW
jgi:hypothetical protein